MPTVLKIVGLPINDQAQGRSLIPTIVSDQPVRQDVHLYDVLKSDRWKNFSSKKMLFDVVDDPEEKNNIYTEHPDIVADRAGSINDWMAGRCFPVCPSRYADAEVYCLPLGDRLVIVKDW